MKDTKTVIVQQSWGSRTPDQQTRKELSASFAPFTLYIEGFPGFKYFQKLAADAVKGKKLKSTFEAFVGASRCHWMDGFDRKVGLKVAKEDTQILKFAVDSISVCNLPEAIGAKKPVEFLVVVLVSVPGQTAPLQLPMIISETGKTMVHGKQYANALSLALKGLV